MDSILIIDDDQELTDLLETYLGDFGYQTTAVHSPSKKPSENSIFLFDPFEQQVDHGDLN